MKASDRLYYIYQTLLDGEELLVGAGEAGQAAKAASSSQLLVRVPCRLLPLLHASVLLQNVVVMAAVDESTPLGRPLQAGSLRRPVHFAFEAKGMIVCFWESGAGSEEA